MHKVAMGKSRGRRRVVCGNMRSSVVATRSVIVCWWCFVSAWGQRVVVVVFAAAAAAAKLSSVHRWPVRGGMRRGMLHLERRVVHRVRLGVRVVRRRMGELPRLVDVGGTGCVLVLVVCD